MPIVIPETPTISIEEAAVLLGIGRDSAYKMAATGELPTIRVRPRLRRVPTAKFLAKFELA